MAELLDCATLDRLRRIGGEKLLRAMLAAFATNGAERIAAAIAAAAAGDADGVVDAAHALKSSAGNIGATDLQVLAARVEQEAKGGGSDLPGLAAELSGAYEVARAAALEERVASAALDDGAARD